MKSLAVCIVCLGGHDQRIADPLPAAGPHEQMRPPAIARVRTPFDQGPPFEAQNHTGERTRMEPQQPRQLARRDTRKTAHQAKRHPLRTGQS